MTHFVRTFLTQQEKLHTSKTFLKMASGRMHTPHLTPLDPPLAISYTNHQKSLAYFSNLTPLILFLFTKKQSKKRGPLHNAQPPPKIRSCWQLLNELV